MGTYSKGILGSFTGKVGTVIGSSWNGIDYMRSLPRPSSKAPTALQLAQREKFGLVTKFVAPIKALLNLGFKNAAVKKTGVNAAVAEIIENGLTATSPYQINYPNMLISKGSLTGAMNGGVTGGSASVTIDWDDNTGSGNATGTDKAIILVYNPAKFQYVYTMQGVARSLTTQNMALPTSFATDTVHVWLAFITEDESQVSTSIYAGQTTIA